LFTDFKILGTWVLGRRTENVRCFKKRPR